MAESVGGSNEAMRERSGSVSSSDPLVALLYWLMRDGHLSPGKVESVLLKLTPGMEYQYTNGWLAE